MKEFIRKHYDHIHGVLSCFDRMLFRGYLPIMSGWAFSGTSGCRTRRDACPAQCNTWRKSC